MNKTQYYKTLIKSQKALLKESEDTLYNLIERIYQDFSLEESNIPNETPVFIIKDRKYILKDEFIDIKIHPRRINSTKEMIKEYQKIISDIMIYIPMLEEELTILLSKND
jgi:hypothetical protein